jgi:hypothetical protein
MKEMTSSNGVFARFASPLIDRVKRIVKEFGIFTDSKAYRDEIVQYESELRQNARDEKQLQPKSEDQGQEVVTS